MKIEDFSLDKMRFNLKERICLDITDLPNGNMTGCVYFPLLKRNFSMKMFWV